MIYSLTGILREKTPDSLVIEAGGVGFLVRVPTSVSARMPDEGETVTIYTYMRVREDAMDLYGFADKAGQRTFKTLTSVSGVGPKVALAILSVLNPRDVALAVASGDYKAFTAASGVGPKVAQRIVLELKGKFTDADTAGVDMSAVSGAAAATTGSVAQATSALIALGYTQSQASLALSKLDPALSVQELIKQALRLIAGGKL